MLKEFRDFAMRGNVVDMAVGIVIGGAFGKIVSSLVAMLLGKVDFSSVFIDLSRKGYESLAAAKAAGAPTINVGLFLNTILDFVIMAFAIFLVVQQMNRLK